MPLPKKPVSKEKALEKLVALCSRSEQCEFDLNRKLINWRVTTDDRQEIIDYLKENRYLDDARFARSYANDKARFSFWGPAKIRGELFKRKIKSCLVNEAIQNVEPQVWKEGLLRCAKSKAGHIDLIGEEGRENKQKLYTYLINRGFPSSAALKAIDLMKKKQEESENDDS